MASYFDFSTFVVALVVAILCYTWETKRRNNKIPGPRGLPVIGYTPFLGTDLHLRFTEMAKRYGPIFRFRLGGNLFVVVSSPSLAKEVLRDVDAPLANRYTQVAASVSSYGCQGVVWSPNGSVWRTNRKICVQQLLSSTSLDSFHSLRQQEVRRAVSDVYSKVGSPVNIRELAHATVLNILVRMLWGAALEGEERRRLSALFHKKLELISLTLGRPNVSDLFPILTRLDLQGVEREMKRHMLWFDSFFDSIIEKRLKMGSTRGEGNHNNNNNNKEEKDFLQVLLDLKDHGDPKTPMTIIQIKALLMDMVFAGIDTTAAMVEWTMAMMLQHPESKKVREELNKVVGMNDIVEESHLPKLHYLEAVQKEVMRLRPFSPLVSPRYSSESCLIGGYNIQKGTKVIVNSWAIHRDPEVWENPLEFVPERFLRVSSTFDYSGNDFRYIPFGSGRRGCAGIPMAEKTLSYIVASFFHSFDWRMPEGTKLDLKEKFQFTIRKEIPMVAIPTARLPEPKLFS